MTDQFAIQLTDPSRELAALGTHLRSSDSVKGQNVLLGLAKCLDVDPSDALYFELLSVIRGRIHRLEQFARTVVDSELDDGLRTDVVKTTKRFAGLFEPKNLITVWDSTRQSCLPDASLKTLMWFGQTAKRHMPLRVLSEADRTQAVQAIEQALAEIQAGEAVGWMRGPLIDGLNRLVVVLKYLSVFGHDVAFNEILLFERKLEGLKDFDSGPALENEGWLSRIYGAMRLVATIGALFVLPNNIIPASQNYYVWLSNAVGAEPSLPYETKLLMPPMAVVPKTEE